MPRDAKELDQQVEQLLKTCLETLEIKELLLLRGGGWTNGHPHVTWGVVSGAKRHTYFVTVSGRSQEEAMRIYDTIRFALGSADLILDASLFSYSKQSSTPFGISLNGMDGWA